MHYPIAETLRLVRERRGVRTEAIAEYMYRTALKRYGIEGNMLLIVQFFHYLLEDLPPDLPKSVVSTLTRMRCSNLMRAHTAPNYRDENHRRYWHHLLNNCAGVHDCEFAIGLSIEAVTAKYHPSKSRGVNLSFVASQLMYLHALKTDVLTKNAYDMLARLAERMELPVEDIDARVQQFHGFFHGYLKAIDHNKDYPVRNATNRARKIIPDGWLTPSDTGATE